jgi:DNA modification methylase
VSITIHQGDAREVLKRLPDNSVHCIVTSPPYFALRSYLPANHLQKELEIGAELTIEKYVENLVKTFCEARRVLHPSGVCFLNIADSFNAGRNGGHPGGKAQWKPEDDKYPLRSGANVPGLKPKDLMLVPFHLAIALQRDGWWVRQCNIWSKPNCMPDSTNDRTTTSHEFVFQLTKRANYFYDAFAIAEDAVSDHPSGNGFKRDARLSYRDENGARGNDQQWNGVGGKRNCRSVWTIPVQPSGIKHFATMAPELAERCVKAGSSEAGCCPHCLSPWERIIEKGQPNREWQRACGGDANGGYNGQSTKGHDAVGVQNASDVKRRILEGMRQKRTAGWRPTCKCPEHSPIACTILDPFCGAATTLLVADRLGRRAIGIDLHPEYAQMGAERVRNDAPLFANVNVAPPPLPQLPIEAAIEEAEAAA